MMDERRLLATPPADWRSAAACAGFDTRPFYGTIAQQRQAAIICRACPVAEACLWEAMLEEHNLPPYHRFGVRGGLLATARSRLATVLTLKELLERVPKEAA